MPARTQYRRGADSGETRRDPYAEVTDRIVASIEAGNLPPWRKPWPSAGWPRNGQTGKRYTGINPWLLTLTAFDRGYSSPHWLTFRQAQELGAHVQAGQNRAAGLGSTDVIKYGEYARKDAEPHPDTGEIEKRGYIKLYGVFNAQQLCRGCDRDDCKPLDASFYPEPGQGMPEDEPERVLDAWQASGKAAAIVFDRFTGAYYDPAADEIHMPPMEQHTSAARYYSTRFHETGHSTGHSSRLNRDDFHKEGITFGCEEYSKEELVAELTAAMLCAETGTENTGTVEQSAAYLKGWASKLADDKRMIISAASQAGKAADLILAPSRQAVAEPEPAEPESAPERDEAADLEIMRAAMARTAGHAPESDHEAA